MDQADDGVWARELFERGQLLWHGAQTSIPGVWAGPLWYYFIAIGYKIFSGDPFGALFMVILLNVFLTGLLMWVIKKKVGGKEALAVGLLLQFFWWFYDTSRWAFNPFPLVTVSTATILLLSEFLEGKKKAFLWAGVVALLGFNFEIAGGAAIFLFYLVFGVYAFLKKKVSLKDFLATGVFIPSVLLSAIVVQLSTQFIKSRFLFKEIEHAIGVFSGTNFLYMGQRFLEMLSYALFPYHLALSLLAFLMLLTLFLKMSKRNNFVSNFVSLTILLTFISWIWFGSNKGWYDWHTVYIPILLFISVLLMALSLPRKAGVVVLAAIILFQLPVFKERYLQYLAPQEDPQTLATELKVLDWIYSKREGEGFNAYTYMPARRDYPYQYLFWWYGRGKYGFMPCEYSIYPHDLKLYVPGREYYTKPQLGCDKFRFLIIEPFFKKDIENFESWYQQTQEGTALVEEVYVGSVRVEKRALVR